MRNNMSANRVRIKNRGMKRFGKRKEVIGMRMYHVIILPKAEEGSELAEKTSAR